MKYKERKRALELRRRGLSYREILQKIPVAKSTLSLWLRSVGLSKRQKHRLTQKQLDAAHRGGEARFQKRIKATQRIYEKTFKDIGSISKRELWLMGVMLYWAEGTKQKEHNVSQPLAFTNSDPAMVRLFIRWLSQVWNIKRGQFKVELYVHLNAKNNLKKIEQFWTKNVDAKPDTVYFKKGKISTNRKRINTDYYGLVRIVVKRSTDLNRKIDGWIKGISVRALSLK